MIIHSVLLKNIKAHRDRKLEFVPGINVLSGANGVGKSTVFEAIGYAMFGVDARDFVGKTDRFVSIGAKKGEISVVFSTDTGGFFQTTRGVGNGAKWLLRAKKGDDFEVEEHANVKETEERIKELLGLDPARNLGDQFKLVIGPFQSDFLGPFIIRQEKKRQDAFDEILGIDTWRKTFKKTSSLLSAVNTRQLLLEDKLEEKKLQLHDLPERKKELAELEKTIGELKTLLEKEEKNLTLISEQLKTLEQKREKLEKCKTKKQVLENRLSDGIIKISQQKKLVENAEDAALKMREVQGAKAAYEIVEKELSQLKQEVEKKHAFEKDFAAKRNELSLILEKKGKELKEYEKAETRCVDLVEQLEKKISQLQDNTNQSELASKTGEYKKGEERLHAQLGQLEGEKSSLAEGAQALGDGQCPYLNEPCQNILHSSVSPSAVFQKRANEIEEKLQRCSVDLTVIKEKRAEAEGAAKAIEHDKVREKELALQLQATEKEREINKKRLETVALLEEKTEQLNNELKKKETLLKQFGNLDECVAKCEEKKKTAQNERDIYMAHMKEAESLEEKRAEFMKMEALYTELTTELHENDAVIKVLNSEYDKEGHDYQGKEKERMVGELARYRQKTVDHHKELKRLSGEVEKLKNIEKEVDGLYKQLNRNKKKKKLISFLRDKVFNRVSAMLSERFREEISLRADIIYRKISEADEELFWGEGYRIILRDMTDGCIRERSDEQLSGGQVMSGVVALRLALLQTIGAKVAFFDEPTSYLDQSRRANLAEAFRSIDVGQKEMGEQWYDQLFLISHDVAFTEVTDQMIELEN